MAVSQRLLPLRCVICRAKILRLKQTLIPRDVSDDIARFISDGFLSIRMHAPITRFSFTYFTVFLPEFNSTRSLPVSLRISFAYQFYA